VLAFSVIPGDNLYNLLPPVPEMPLRMYGEIGCLGNLKLGKRFGGD